ncbi:ferrochelatase [Halorussus lipolyticus]|uniref:ferrochelatase n=1 Tax=Halorussus lipolyticus TaxID=3034024 RepID=UPI0023E7E8F9|nr:ferrochelatase [Halorussus sp. DT80]
MTTGIVLLNFGEPAEPTRENVVDYLERIFLNNASLEEADTEEEKRQRARQLAERRAPGLIEEYEEIGGSPLNPQAEAQADALEAELTDRGYDVETYLGMQFTEPFVSDAVESAHADDVDQLVGLPVYPLCGASTTVAANEDLREAVESRDWDVPVAEITGWHRHPLYNEIRAENVRRFADAHGLDLHDDGTELVYSAHGTPRHYLDEGSRYDMYVEEFCEVVGRKLGVDGYSLGYQNHENRDIPWTEPEVEDVIEDLGDEEGIDRVVVEPISFMHEQSETLSELDDELREEAEEVGLDFYRVPVPHDDDRFKSVLGDLAEPFVGEFDPGYYQFRECQCSDSPGAMCLNAPR